MKENRKYVFVFTEINAAQKGLSGVFEYSVTRNKPITETLEADDDQHFLRPYCCEWIMRKILDYIAWTKSSNITKSLGSMSLSHGSAR